MKTKCYSVRLQCLTQISSKCWIVHFSNEEIQRDDTLDNIDEEKVIKHICENKKYSGRTEGNSALCVELSL